MPGASRCPTDESFPAAPPATAVPGTTVSSNPFFRRYTERFEDGNETAASAARVHRLLIPIRCDASRGVARVERGARAVGPPGAQALYHRDRSEAAALPASLRSGIAAAVLGLVLAG